MSALPHTVPLQLSPHVCLAAWTPRELYRFKKGETSLSSCPWFASFKRVDLQNRLVFPRIFNPTLHWSSLMSSEHECNGGRRVTKVGGFDLRVRGERSYERLGPFVLSICQFVWPRPPSGSSCAAVQRDITDEWTDRDALPSAVNSDSHEPFLINLWLLILWHSLGQYESLVFAGVICCKYSSARQKILISYPFTDYVRGFQFRSNIWPSAVQGVLSVSVFCSDCDSVHLLLFRKFHHALVLSDGLKPRSC